ncbi:hypothetical protein JOB18_048899, partial [Solea senegalensis]
MANHLELIQELQQLDKVPSLERLRAAQKRRTQQLKRWAVYEKEMQSKKRKAEKKGRSANHLQHGESKKHVSFAASVALLEASARNDPDEGGYQNAKNPSMNRCNLPSLIDASLQLLFYEDDNERSRDMKQKGGQDVVLATQLQWQLASSAVMCNIMYYAMIKISACNGFAALEYNPQMRCLLCAYSPGFEEVRHKTSQWKETQRKPEEACTSFTSILVGLLVFLKPAK